MVMVAVAVAAAVVVVVQRSILRAPNPDTANWQSPVSPSRSPTGWRDADTILILFRCVLVQSAKSVCLPSLAV